MTNDPPTDEVFGFAEDPEPTARPIPPMLGSNSYGAAPAAGEELDLTEDELPRRPRPDILERPLDEPTRPWWQVPLLTLAIGLVLCLVPIVAVAFQKGAGTGLVIALMAIGGLTVQVLMTSGLLAVVGQLFGIDYGPAPEAVLKLAAIDSVVTGLLGGGAALAYGQAAWGVPCGLLFAFVAGFALFQTLFRLSISEVLLTLFGLWLVSLAGIALLGGLLKTGR